MNFDAMRATLNASVPFAHYTGVVVTALDAGRATATLPERSETLNHVGSQHAGALFTVAEAASGAAMVGAFGDLLATATPLVPDASIRYLKVARGAIVATAGLEGDLEALRSALADQGRVDFIVAVRLADVGGVEVATMTVQWSIRARPAAAAGTA